MCGCLLMPDLEKWDWGVGGCSVSSRWRVIWLQLTGQYRSHSGRIHNCWLLLTLRQMSDCTSERLCAGAVCNWPELNRLLFQLGHLFPFPRNGFIILEYRYLLILSIPPQNLLHPRIPSILSICYYEYRASSSVRCYSRPLLSLMSTSIYPSTFVYIYYNDRWVKMICRWICRWEMWWLGKGWALQQYWAEGWFSSNNEWRFQILLRTIVL